MTRLLFGPGARGQSIRTLQEKLTAAGFDTRGIDERYGPGTTAAVKAWQQKETLPATGEVDDVTWTGVTNLPIPSMLERCLGLTSAFEGHGYTLAEGNFDGAGVTWGIIGFTLKAGVLTAIIKGAYEADANCVRGCFGTDTDSLMKILDQPWEQQLAWANSVSSKGALIEPWKGAFAKLGQTPLGQQLQQKHVEQDYFNPALATAKRYGLTSELGVALAFDLHVQNGGIRKSVGTTILATSYPSEQDKRIAIANGVADAATAAWREDVRKRKLTIATGQGNVHGVDYVVKNWGLAELTA